MYSPNPIISMVDIVIVIVIIIILICVWVVKLAEICAPSSTCGLYLEIWI